MRKPNCSYNNVEFGKKQEGCYNLFIKSRKRAGCDPKTGDGAKRTRRDPQKGWALFLFRGI